MIYGVDLFFSLFNNLAIFIALVAIYGSLLVHFKKAIWHKRQIIIGLSFGFFAIVCMYAKIPVFEGVIVDQRNAVITLSGAFGGPLSAIISASLAGVLRISLGGDGTLAGVIGVCLAAIAGVGLHQFPGQFTSIRKAAAASLIATIIILPGFLFVGDIYTGWKLLKAMTLPYGLAIFSGIFLVGLLLNREEDRYQFELAFRESEKKYRDLIEGTEDLITHTDKNGNFTFVNHVADKILGVMPKDCVGKASFDFIHPDDKDMTIEWFNKCVAQKKTQAKIENRQVNVKTGESFTVLWSSAFDYDESGELSGVGGIGRDITLRKKAEKEKSAFEAQLRHTQKMEAVGTLSGGIAHDFNNILTVILGYAEMVKNQIQDWSPAKKDIDEVLKAGNRAKELVKQILAFSRKAEPRPVPLEIHLLIKETINFLRATLPTTIKIQTNIDPDIGYILADPSQIHQVLMNLCTNAFHAMEETGGILSIDSTVVDLKPDQLEKEPGLKPGPYVLISVKDTGAGIKNELIDRIFDPYFTTKEFGKGTGMGLAVVHGIMKSHNGLITVDSMPDQGTTFKLFFPETEAGADEQPPDKISMPAGKEKILIADDDISIANLTKKRLEILGYQATAKTSSLDILELFRTNPNAFDLLITDQTMPDMTGEQLAKEFIGIRPDIRIIMCTGYSSTIDADRANHIGISAFIMKPVDHLTLAKTVRMVLDAT